MGVGAGTDRAAGTRMNPGETLADRYLILRELGRGGAGITWLARDTATGKEVVAKILHLGLLEDWKAVELFQREASVLKGLHHDRIPAYVASFTVNMEGVTRFVLVREYVEGTSLQASVDSGWRGTEGTIREIGIRLARIVAYIHSVRPPVIHRDINPRNIIRRDDGEVFLVDFGGVQDAIRLSAGGTSTIVGTPGYTPMEQFVGRASVRSDLYAMAATLLFLLTHRNPADLPVKEMKVDFSSVIEITAPGLSRVLADWLEPDESKRRIGIEDAIALLEGKAPPSGAKGRDGPSPTENRPLVVPAHPPHGSRMTRTEEGDAVRYLVPGGAGGRGLPAFGGFVFFWLIFGGFWSSSAFRTGPSWSVLLMSAPFLLIGLSMAWWVLSSIFGKLGMEISARGVTTTRRFLFFSRSRSVPLEDVGECRLEEGRDRSMRRRGGWGSGWDAGWGSGMGMRWDGMYRHRSRSRHEGRSSTRLALDTGASTLYFGENLSAREREWLRDSINGELQKAKAARRELS
jgi:eukaryotic-like serine/threonine-protein kinase